MTTSAKFERKRILYFVVLIFDLDDTLYPEQSFVEGGFRAVAEHAKVTWGWDDIGAFRDLSEIILRDGRGAVFDTWLRAHNSYSRSRVAECIRIYRYHDPSIELYPEAESFLRQLNPKTPLYLVTDGNKLVQQRKIEALVLGNKFRKLFITHRFGLSAAKPSTLCFEKIRAIEACQWDSMVYVGDNPAKDFVNLKKLGVFTVRVLTGNHSASIAKSGFDADATIPSLEWLPDIIRGLQ